MKNRRMIRILEWLFPVLFLVVIFVGINSAQAQAIGTNSASADQLSPGFKNPSGLLVFEAVNWIGWICLFVYFIRQSIHARTLTFGMLLLISTTTLFWQDAYQAWSVYILYNPKFHMMPWGSTLWTTPNKAWFTPAGYGVFYTCSFLIVLLLIEKFRRRFPNFSRTAAIIIVTLPVYYIWDLINEGGAAVCGWYSYTYYFGPAIEGSKGNFPLIYPIVVLVLWTVIPIYLLSLRGPDGRVLFESWFLVERIRSVVSRDIARLGVWILMMNALYLCLTIPLIIVRNLFGVSSTLVP